MLKKICTDLDTSKKLKELGIEAGTCFYWIEMDYKDSMKWELMFNIGIELPDDYYHKAYSLETILEMLPAEYHFRDKMDYNMAIRKYKDGCGEDGYSIGWHNESGELNTVIPDLDKNLATAAASFLIQLKKDKII